MKVKEIAGKDEKELKDLLAQRRKDLFDLNLENKQNKLKNTRSLFNTRKEIAKIMTLIREKELITAAKAKEEVKAAK
jgi:large subunit ribosomal protein L29